MHMTRLQSSNKPYPCRHHLQPQSNQFPQLLLFSCMHNENKVVKSFSQKAALQEWQIFTRTIQYDTYMQCMRCSLEGNTLSFISIFRNSINTKTDKAIQFVTDSFCTVLFCSCGAAMEAVAGMLLHSTALRPVSCTGPMRIPGVCVCVCV